MPSGPERRRRLEEGRAFALGGRCQRNCLCEPRSAEGHPREIRNSRHMPRKPIGLPPEVGLASVKDMRDFLVAGHKTIKTAVYSICAVGSGFNLQPAHQA